MSHRVIQFDSIAVDESTADQLQTDIQEKLDKEAYNLHDRNVNDGSNLQGDATLAVKTDHDKDTEANSFFDWLKSWTKTHESVFESARLRIHDCQHLEGLEAPCKIGNAWEL